MPQPVEGNGRYIAGLDGIRALAVLAVIAYHLNVGWAPGGLLGVAVFFVLSGYLITDLLLTQRERTGRIALGQFWERRARRLLPALWVMLLVVVVWITIAQPAALPALRGDVVASFVYVSNWWYVFQHVSYFAGFGQQSPLGHLWSLGVEEQFYLVWPLLLLLALRFVSNRRVLVLLVLLAAAASAVAMAILYTPGGDPNRVYYGTDTRAFELLIGAALAMLWPSGRLIHHLSRRRRVMLDGAGACGLLIIGLMVWGTTEYQPFLYRGGLVLLSLGAAATVAAVAHPSTRVGRVLGFQPLRWIGARSYGIYLWHFPVIALTTPLVDTPGTHWIRSGLQLGASFVIAALSWRFIEDPIRRAGIRPLLTRVRSVRWPMVGLPTGVWEPTAVSALIVIIAAAGLVGVVSPSSPMNPVSQLTASVVEPASLQTGPQALWSCIGALPRPAAQAASSVAQQPAPPSVQVTAIGDSIMIDVAPFLQALVPGAEIDGQVSRQMYQLSDLLDSMRAAGTLRSRLVIELGTNGPFDEAQLASTLRSLGPMKRIVLVNTQVPRDWEQDVNDTLVRVAKEVPATTLVDWYTTSAGHPEWFDDDGVHPNPSGAQVMASMIARAVNPPAPPPPPPGQGGTPQRCASH
ncbi:MAG: acetyltransferase [Candidatus Dormibacteraeota bacterium]|nr:acetyltransferase [Candidatus Dormibacteraeota bacterium]